MKRFAGSAAMISATWLATALVTPTAASSAAQDSATASIPIDAITTLEIHTTANCVKADNQCYFDTAANLPRRGWCLHPVPRRHSTQSRTPLCGRSNRMVYLDSDFEAPNTRMFKSIGPVEFATVYFDGGPPEKFMLHGNTRTVDWSTGQPKTDADFIACAFIQVVYGGVNLTTPTACAQTTYS